MAIHSIQGLRSYLYFNSGFSKKTVNCVIKALGYPLSGSAWFKELSAIFSDCSKKGANVGFTGFSYPNDTATFFMENKQDIICHMVQTAADIGTDIISLVQGFGIFQNTDKPTPSEVGQALWDSKKLPEFSSLYNVFAWYALEEISRTWYRYLEDNQLNSAELSA